MAHQHGGKFPGWGRLWEEEAGQDVVEYALLILLVALVAVASTKTVGSGVANIFSNVTANLASGT
jgi:Flp pilus assembly pilin Flp